MTNECATTLENSPEVEKFKRRMLAWSNPVEFVNNMYGCHPDAEGSSYFEKIFTI